MKYAMVLGYYSGVPISFNRDWVNFASIPLVSTRLEPGEPTPYKVRGYKKPVVNRSFHRQSVNRGK